MHAKFDRKALNASAHLILQSSCSGVVPEKSPMYRVRKKGSMFGSLWNKMDPIDIQN